MHKIKYIINDCYIGDEPIYGNLIDYKDGNFCLCYYGINEYGTYDEQSCVPLPDELLMEVIEAGSLLSKFNLVYGYFKNADYLSSRALGMLNLYFEDDEAVLSEFVTFD